MIKASIKQKAKPKPVFFKDILIGDGFKTSYFETTYYCLKISHNYAIRVDNLMRDLSSLAITTTWFDPTDLVIPCEVKLTIEVEDD